MLEVSKGKFSNILNDVEIFFKKYEFNSQDIIKLQKEIDDFQVTLPIVGGFSSGKSSLLNALLGEKLLQVEIDPMTAIPTELSYSDTDSFFRFRNDSWMEISRKDVMVDSFDPNVNEILKINLNNTFLKEIKNIRLVDLPGLDSGIEAHTKAIDNYLPKSLAYIITVDIEQGLKASLINFLKELNIYNMPVFVVITKSDKKSEADVKLFEADVRAKVSSILGLKSFCLTTVSSKRNDVDGVKVFLNQLQKDADDLFVNYFKGKISELIHQIEQYLSTRIKNSDLNFSEINEQEETLLKQMNQILTSFAKEKDSFQNQAERSIKIIENKVRLNLEESVELLVDDLISNIDINSRINLIIRKSITEGIKAEFEPKMQKYFRNISNIIDMAVDVDRKIEINEFSSKVQNFAKDMVLKSIPAICTAIGISISGPIGAVVAGGVVLLVEFFFQQKQQEDRKKMAENKVRNEIIPSVLRQIEQTIQSIIQNYVEEINGQIETKICEEKQNKEKALNDLRSQKVMKENEQKRIIAELNLDLSELEILIGRL